MNFEEPKVINVLNCMGNPNPMDENDGEKLYQAINSEKEKNKGTHIIVDFEGIESFTTAVINRSIAVFVIEHGIEDVVQWLKIKGIDSNDKVKIIKYSLSLAHDKYMTRNLK